MHRLLFLLLNLLLLQTVTFAQNFSVNPNPAYAEADLDDPSTQPNAMQALAEVSNNTSDTLFLKWERILEDTPDSWETIVCDPNICVFPSTDSREFILYPNQMNQLLVEAWPGGSPGDINDAIPGEATVKLKVTNLNDLSDTLIATYYFNLEGDPILNTSEAKLEALKLYPNPVSDYFKFTETQEVKSVVLYDILGRQVKNFDVNGNQQFEINDLPNGSYLIALIGNDQKLLKTLQFQKI